MRVLLPLAAPSDRFGGSPCSVSLTFPLNSSLDVIRSEHRRVHVHSGQIHARRLRLLSADQIGVSLPHLLEESSRMFLQCVTEFAIPKNHRIVVFVNLVIRNYP